MSERRLVWGCALVYCGRKCSIGCNVVCVGPGTHVLGTNVFNRVQEGVCGAVISCNVDEYGMAGTQWCVCGCVSVYCGQMRSIGCKVVCGGPRAHVLFMNTS